MKQADMKKCRVLCTSMVLWAVIGIGGCGGRSSNLPAVQNFQIDTLLGNWHEVARLPLPFEINCAAVSFEYIPVRSDKILVNHYCWYKSINGPMRRTTADVRLLQPEDHPGQLLIQFAGPFAGRYDVFYISQNEQVVLIGDPKRRYLWILAKSLSPSPEQVRTAIETAAGVGFDVAELVFSQDLLPMAKQFLPSAVTTAEVKK
ncbi:MAG: lipocalin family protein [Deltaproteobacteria bacterium]|nr:lipocalin family protein [Deltaproteobacteria bacterium]MBN2674588.1 lipocalin family protein [Deltaproteobacteria bacterium]